MVSGISHGSKKEVYCAWGEKIDSQSDRMIFKVLNKHSARARKELYVNWIDAEIKHWSTDANRCTKPFRTTSAFKFYQNISMIFQEIVLKKVTIVRTVSPNFFSRSVCNTCRPVSSYMWKIVMHSKARNSPNLKVRINSLQMDHSLCLSRPKSSASCFIENCCE